MSDGDGQRGCLQGGRWFEFALTCSLPWLGLLLLTVGRCQLQAPRAGWGDPDRLFAVAAGIDGESPPALVDLAHSTTTSLHRVSDKPAARAAYTFQPELVRGAVATQPVRTGLQPCQILLAYPDALSLGQPQVLVNVQRDRLFPPSTWDSFLYQYLPGRELHPLLILRDQPLPLEVERDGLGRWAFGHAGLARRNLQMQWAGQRFEPAPRLPLVDYLVYLLSTGFTPLAWWAGLLTAVPVLALLLTPAAAIGVLWRRLSDPDLAQGMGGMVVVTAGLAALPGYLLGLVGAAWVRLDVLFDPATAMLTPVLLSAGWWLGTTVGCRLGASVAAGATRPRQEPPPAPAQEPPLRPQAGQPLPRRADRQPLPSRSDQLRRR